MRKCLYALFGQFGKVIDVVAMKTERLRGQAWIVYTDVTGATNALRAMQDFPFFGKAMVRCLYVCSSFGHMYRLHFFTHKHTPLHFIDTYIQRVQYGKTTSDATAKLEGTWHNDKRTRRSAAPTTTTMDTDEGEGDDGGRKRKSRGEGKEEKTTKTGEEEDIVAGEPHNILFLENLPEATTEAMLGVLFKQFPGYKESRLVPGKAGIAFVEFVSEKQAAVALAGLQGFKITPQHAMRVIYAKK